ncbi:MAG: nitroreductase family protein [Candidatus Krumholzibacteriia bacterium]
MTPAGDDLDTVYSYHEATKHHPARYARSLGYLDWATQPDPFLRLAGAPLVPLPAPADRSDPAWDQVPAGGLSPAPLDAATVSRLLWTSLALSAWKQVDGPDGQILSRWSLRVNPSSGNLHPTEGWLACGPDAGLADTPALWHYRPDAHALERCRDLDAAAWAEALGPGRILVALSSVVWREAWKYGERAFRYCCHDTGHALAAVDLAAAALGWSARLLDNLDDGDLGRFLGCDRREGPEQDHPDALVLIDTTGSIDDVSIERLDGLSGGAGAAAAWHGVAEPLSPSHQAWPVLDQVRAAVRWPGRDWPPRGTTEAAAKNHNPLRPSRFTPLVRARRSAVAMDGRTPLPAVAFHRLLARLLPERSPRPFGLLPWPPAVSLVLFVHRVEDLAPGLYLLARDPSHIEDLRAALRPESAWEPVAGAPADLPLFRLGAGDLRSVARDLSCHQDIAAAGAFAVAMLARFDATLADAGPGFYPRLFWETGAIGQMLYLEADAAGLQGTGIGCFFDDEVHRLLGLSGTPWQSLYHFTVGGAVHDSRIRTEPAYPHLPG